MNGILKTSLLLCLLCGLGSCAVFSGTKQRAEHPLRDVQKLTDPATGKEVICIWMQHLSSEKGYDEIRNYLDRLKANGYVTFCESVIAVPFHIDTLGRVTMRQLMDAEYAFSRTDSMQCDTLMRKCRRMLGFMVDKKGYADSTNLSLPNSIRKHKTYVSQTKERLGMTTDRDIWVDYSLRDIVEVYESKYGEIQLTDYDFTTGLLEKYTPPVPVSGRQRDRFQLFLRNDNAVRRIAESEHPKIVLVYGAGHSFGIVYQLKKHHGYKIDRKFKVGTTNE